MSTHLIENTSVLLFLNAKLLSKATHSVCGFTLQRSLIPPIPNVCVSHLFLFSLGSYSYLQKQLLKRNK